VRSLNPFSCKIQIFKVRVQVSYFFTKLWKSSTIFHGRTMAMAAMNMVSAGGVFGGKLSFKKMSAGGCLCTSQENPHFWVTTIKVRPPDGSSYKLAQFSRIQGWFFLLNQKFPMNGYVETRITCSRWVVEKVENNGPRSHDTIFQWLLIFHRWLLEKCCYYAIGRIVAECRI
jgi:hypothetical protein